MDFESQSEAFCGARPTARGMTDPEIVFWFKLFVVEVCKKDGTCYPPDNQLFVALTSFFCKPGPPKRPKLPCFEVDVTENIDPHAHKRK